jgi:hypothetical protein
MGCVSEKFPKNLVGIIGSGTVLLSFIIVVSLFVQSAFHSAFPSDRFI